MKLDGRRLIKATIKGLGSRELAASTMLAWAGLILLWVVPFEFYGLPALQIKNIVYKESFFVIVYGLLALNLLACIVPRIPVVVRRVRRTVRPDEAPILPDQATHLEVEWSSEKAVAALSTAGFRKTVVGDGWVWGVRNRLSPLGNLLFHLALFAVAGAALITLDPRATYMGKAVVAEGEEFNTATGVFSEEPIRREARPEVAFKLEQLTPAFYRDILLFTALEGVISSDGRKHPISLSSPWLKSPTTSVAVEDFGYALDTVWDVTGINSVRRSYKLKVFPSGLADSFELKGVGKVDYEVTVRVYGDYVDRQGRPGSRSFNLREPRMQVRVDRILSSGGRHNVIEEALLEPGERLVLPDSTLTISAVDYYAVFRIYDSWAAPLLMLGLLMLATGTSMRLLFPRQEALVAKAGSNEVLISVRDEAYRSAVGREGTVKDSWETVK